ncbi:response regulator transcription factor [Paenibacillus chitinolyticus]|uniref:response regulator transcription factor n=1 Tax=Paenibacillus chitinolyticus TaxID=79263 RepID=UPI003D090A25
MYNVMLIDDDVPMLKYLHKLIDWEACGLHVAGETYSSVRALQMFKELLPDIVVTDIGLPQMNGLELAAQFSSIKPGVRIIFLTCHEDFHYAKQALLLNADDYLIKDELTEDQLLRSLKQSVGRIQQSVVSLEQVSYREDVNRNRDLLKESLFQRLIKGTEADGLLGYAERLGVEWKHPAYALLLGHLSLTGLPEKYASRDMPLLRYGVYNIACEVAQTYEGVTVFNTGDFLVILLNYRPGLTFNEKQYLHDYTADLRDKCDRFLHVGLRFWSSPARLELSSAGPTFRSMAKNRYRFYYADSGYAAPKFDDGSEVYYLPAEGLFGQELEDIGAAAAHRDHALLEEAIERIRRTACGKLADPEELNRLCVRKVRQLFIQQARPGADTEEDEWIPYLQTAMHVDDALAVFGWMIQRLMIGTDTGAAPAVKEPKLQVIDDYIYRHLGENVSSIDVAEHLFMNPSYFSRYFKRLTGESFTDYAHRYKVKIACKALQMSEDPVELIAAKLGYSDRTYFSKVFKKYTGRTPREYRER